MGFGKAQQLGYETATVKWDDGTWSTTGQSSLESVAETQVHSCGHEGTAPRNMRRGKAKAKRLEQFFGHKCLACTLAQSREHWASLSVRVDGKTMPLSIADPEGFAEKIAADQARIERLFRS